MKKVIALFRALSLSLPMTACGGPGGSADGSTAGNGVNIEASGMLYNADTIKNITGENFDPASITTPDKFNAFLDKRVAGGMEAPTAILKPDWSLIVCISLGIKTFHYAIMPYYFL